jgi:hypothetical protein
MNFGKCVGIVVTLSILIVGSGISLAQDEPGPFERLFRALRHGLNEPQHRSSHRPKRKQTQESVNPPRANDDADVRTGNGTVSKPPNEKNTRGASKATARKGEDLPYGTPVPGKQGFVTSPFSPNSGYIDVRGFAPGTPVKDPYTGKVFLAP